MTKTIWTFGDSLTDYFTPPLNLIRHWRHDYIEWKGYSPKVYGEIISEKLNYNLVNKGIGGCDNHQIFEEFCKVSHLIQREDVIIFGWTNQERFRLVNKNGGWTSFYVNFRNKNKKDIKTYLLDLSLDMIDSVSKETVQQIMFNRSNINYVEEVENWIKLINIAFKDNKTIHWSWDHRMRNSTIILELARFQNIKTETNGIVDDVHWSERGHIDMANFILEIITNTPTQNRNII